MAEADNKFSAVALEQITPQLDNLSAADLKKLAERVAAKTKEVEQRERQQAVEQIMQIAANIGMPLSEILTYRAPGAAVMYRNPDNPQETWGGKGARPKWVKAYIAAGNNMDKLRV